MMDILFNDDELLLQQMQETFNKVEGAIYKNHYELSNETEFSALSWKKFFTHPEVNDWITQEMILVQQSKLRLLLRDIDGNTKSTGLPQLINTLTSQLQDKNKRDEGPVFVYTYVPLNQEEKHAPNVQMANEDFTVKDITKV